MSNKPPPRSPSFQEWGRKNNPTLYVCGLLAHQIGHQTNNEDEYDRGDKAEGDHHG